jgi:drug/metabolite transporter (DMT)-like permease
MGETARCTRHGKDDAFLWFASGSLPSGDTNVPRKMPEIAALAEPLLPDAPTPRIASDVVPVLLMVASELLLATVNAIVKFVDTWRAEQIMFVRFSVDLCLCVCVCASRGLGVPSRADVFTLCLRGLAYCCGVLFFWAAIRSCLPVGDVVVLLISASPLFLVVLARLLLAERIPKEWPVQMIFLTIGAILVNKPGSLSDGCPASTALLPVGAAVSWCFMNFASRRVPHLPSVQVMLFNDTVAVVFACATSIARQVVGSGDGGGDGLGIVDALRTLVPPPDRSTLLVVASAVFGWLGLMGNVKGYQQVSVAAVASVAASASIPFNYCYQVLLFHDPIDAYSAVGAGIIAATTVVMTIARHFDARRKERATVGVCNMEPSATKPGLATTAAEPSATC